MKTTQLRDFYRVLSELNNGFTHYSFVWNQFCIDYIALITENQEILTKDYFVSNPYKSKHNIKLKELEKEHNKTDTTLIKGIFLLIYSNFESYLKNILEFSQKIDSNIKSFDEKLEGIETDSILIDKVFNRLSIVKSDFIVELMDTLDYLRLKRNRLTHQNSINISTHLNSFIRTKGQAINEYWDNNLPSQRQGIDFADKENVNQLTFSIVIDTINIFRRVALEVDTKIISKLEKEKIVEKIIIPEFKIDQHRKINNISLDKLISKFTRFCVLEYALTVDDRIIELLKSSIA